MTVNINLKTGTARSRFSFQVTFGFICKIFLISATLIPIKPRKIIITFLYLPLSQHYNYLRNMSL